MIKLSYLLQLCNGTHPFKKLWISPEALKRSYNKNNKLIYHDSTAWEHMRDLAHPRYWIVDKDFEKKNIFDAEESAIILCVNGKPKIQYDKILWTVEEYQRLKLRNGS